MKTFKHLGLFGIIILGVQALSITAHANPNTNTKIVDGYNVSVCNPYHDGSVDNSSISPEFKINFCDQRNINAYKKFTLKDVNFNKDYVLVRLEKYHYIAINPKTKNVYPMPVAIYQENEKGEWLKATGLTFNKDNNHVCLPYQKAIEFHYSNLYIGQEFVDERYPYCYEFSNNEQDKGFSPMVITEPLKNLGFKKG